MAKAGQTKILGLRLDEKIIRAAKSEAAQRGIPVSKLFEELWSQYKRPSKA